MCKVTQQSSLGWTPQWRWGVVAGMVKQEFCLSAAGIPCGDFAVLSLSSTRLQRQLGV